MVNTIKDDLFSIASILKRRARFIVLVTLGCAMAAAGFYLLKPKQYIAETVFMLRNPMYADRNYIYNNDMKFVDYFASDDDITRFISMSWTDSVRDKVIREMDLAKAYSLDVTQPKEADQLKKLFSKKLWIYRSEDKNVVLTYVDTSQTLAIAVASKTLSELERALHSYYLEMRMDIRNSISNKIREEDSMIAVLTDSLVHLRDRYGIYDIVSPSRSNLVMPVIKSSGKPGFARGLEEVQNVESVKDQLVSDKARQISLMNQYSTGLSLTEMPLTRIVNATKIPLKRKDMGGFVTVVTAAFFGFFFSLLFVLVMSFYKTKRAAAGNGTSRS